MEVRGFPFVGETTVPLKNMHRWLSGFFRDSKTEIMEVFRQDSASGRWAYVSSNSLPKIDFVVDEKSVYNPEGRLFSHQLWGSRPPQGEWVNQKDDSVHFTIVTRDRTERFNISARILGIQIGRYGETGGNWRLIRGREYRPTDLPPGDWK